MAYDKDYTKRETLPHSLSLEGRASANVSGVEDVESFDENAVVLFTSAGMLTVRGRDLHLEKLSLDGGELAITGQIDSLQYEDAAPVRGSIWARLMR